MFYYDQYKELYEEAQTDKNKGKYKAFVFDVKGSKVHSSRDNDKFYEGLWSFFDETVNNLLELEKVRGHKIIHRHLELKDIKEGERVLDKVALLRSIEELKQPHSNKILRADQLNPAWWLGDSIYFIVERDSISDKEFMQIIQKNKDNTIPNYDLYFASGYYETDVWAESSDKFSRTYCLVVLDELAKKYNKIITSPDHLKEQSQGRQL